jgi:hypothetical protein
MLQRMSLKELACHQRRWPASQSTPLAGQPWFVANQFPVMRAEHHQRAKVPPLPEVVEHARLMLFPLI